jgi:hypothetical protein
VDKKQDQDIAGLTVGDLLNIVRQAVDPVGDDVRHLQASVGGMLAEIRKEVQENEKRITLIERIYGADGARAVERMELFEGRVKAVEDAVTEFRQVARMLRWLGAGVGGLVLALLWGILTNQVQVTFP